MGIYLFIFFFFLSIDSKVNIFQVYEKTLESTKIFEIDRELFTDEYRYRLYGRIKGNV